ncbi:hypothetical protein [Rhodohalobacter sp. SW132]|uniref:hypothetical protein n=2 Tax=Rhodohalobacter sp. SW132 TaxID=2293433 RepID=UPI0018F525D3|nr:hypothetical protein [Rhodohalobacter sp. SW132]
MVIHPAGFDFIRYIFEKMSIDMISKKSVIQGLEQLPDQFSVDELFERLLVIEKIETGLQQSKDKKTVSTEEAKQKLGKWLG